jgi:adenine-specific DNA-methyltransferase
MSHMNARLAGIKRAAEFEAAIHKARPPVLTDSHTPDISSPMPSALSPQLFEATPTSIAIENFPKTRYQGSKRRLVKLLQRAFQSFCPKVVLDLYSGTGTVSLLLDFLGWQVIANDFLAYNNLCARVLLNNPPSNVNRSQAGKELRYLLEEGPVHSPALVSQNFPSIFFTHDENLQIDRFCQNIGMIDDPRSREVYIYAVGQSLLMKRPFNLFHRANLNIRTRDVARSFGNKTTWNKPILTHAEKIVTEYLRIPPRNKNSRHIITSQNTLNLDGLPDEIDMVYLDPPYLNRNGQGVDYCEFYHFLEGLCDYELFSKYDGYTPHRQIMSNETAWLECGSAINEIRRVLNKWPRAIIALSYRSDGLPRLDQIAEAFAEHGRVIRNVDSERHKYVLSNQTGTSEVVVISDPAEYTKSERTTNVATRQATAVSS